MYYNVIYRVNLQTEIKSCSYSIKTTIKIINEMLFYKKDTANVTTVFAFTL